MRIKLKQSIVVGRDRLDKGRVYAASQMGNNREFHKHGFITVFYAQNKTTVLIKGEYTETLKAK